MIDPHFWESAEDNNWNSDDCLIMIAAISCSDDEGRGRISAVKKQISHLIQDKKFQKSLTKLSNSIKIYEKIYYFLPNWEEYQTISHPTPSKYPNPNLLINNNLVGNISGKTPEYFSNDSTLIEDKIREVNIKEYKIIEEKKTESAGSSRDFETPNFEEKESVVSAITNLFNYIGNSKPDYKAEIEPVYEAIHDKRQGMMPDITYPEIIDSFVVMKRKDSVKTDFLLGIIRNKLNKKFSVLQETKTTRNQNISNRSRAEASAKERADEAERISEKVRYYREFYEKNEEIFSAKEKADILKYLNGNMMMNLALVIEPKIEEMVTL